MKPHRRKSIRLKGFDYSEPGSYFVTICTKERACILGHVVDGVMKLSEFGKIVETCWREIPEHFENIRVDRFQIMPNHVHGIINIKEPLPPVGVEYIQPLQGLPSTRRSRQQNRYQHVTPKSLGSIVRSFKGAVTREIHRNTKCGHEILWQRNFYDHIIRDDVDHFFVEQYIALNPLMWNLDKDNPRARQMPTDLLRKTLQKEHGLSGMALERMIEYELSYREWSWR